MDEGAFLSGIVVPLDRLTPNGVSGQIAFRGLPRVAVYGLLHRVSLVIGLPTTCPSLFPGIEIAFYTITYQIASDVVHVYPDLAQVGE